MLSVGHAVHQASSMRGPEEKSDEWKPQPTKRAPSPFLMQEVLRSTLRHGKGVVEASLHLPHG